MSAAVVCPECRDGKHVNCIGYALDPETDVVDACRCEGTDSCGTAAGDSILRREP